MAASGVRQRSWPGNWLVPGVDVLKAQIVLRVEDMRKQRRLELQLEQLPYCLGATSYALCELITTQNVTVTLSLLSRTGGENLQVIRPDRRDRMGFLVDSTLEAARRAQNALLLYIARACKLALPASMANLAGSDRHLARLPSLVAKSLANYWQDHGQRLRDYRNLSQHHAVVSSDARVFVSSEGIPGIYLVLPNNPEDKNVSRLRYEEPYVHAVRYLQNEFLHLVKVCNVVCEALIEKGKPRMALTGQPLKSALELGRAIQGNRLMKVEGLEKVLRKNLPSLRPPVAI